MRILPAAILAAMLGSPAFAQEMSTLQHMVAKGIVVKFPGLDLDVTYHPDGRYTAMNGAATGTWRIEGEALCAKAITDSSEACTRYPAGKKPGDEFEVDGPQGGVVTIRINP